MSKFIELTRCGINGDGKVLININNVFSIYQVLTNQKHSPFTAIQPPNISSDMDSGDMAEYVIETPEQIMELLNENSDQ